MPFKSREQQLAYWRAYGSRNKARKAAYDREYATVNRERRRAQAIERRRLAPERERQRAAQRYAEARAAVIDAYGAACVCCGNDFTSHLTIDHVNGGGRRDRAENGGNRSIYARIRREGFPPDYQVLCFNCNHAKHVLGRCCCSDVCKAHHPHDAGSLA